MAATNNGIIQQWIAAGICGSFIALGFTVKAVGSFQGGGSARMPAFAGKWYERSPERLGAYIESAALHATPAINVEHATQIIGENRPIDGNVLALICPHAAYKFSGQAAARAYKLVHGQPIHRVFLLGPWHKGRSNRAVLPRAKSFMTPLGSLRVDRMAVEALAQTAGFIVDDRPHKSEHSLEMQLPLIRELVGPVTLVPILIGTRCSEDDTRAFAEAIKRQLKPDDLVIISTDFTHYGDRYNYKPFAADVPANIHRLDQTAYAAVSSLNPQKWWQFERETHDDVCGSCALAVLLNMLPANVHATLVDYYTSYAMDKHEAGWTDADWSVSYFSIAVSGRKWRG